MGKSQFRWRHSPVPSLPSRSWALAITVGISSIFFENKSTTKTKNFFLKKYYDLREAEISSKSFNLFGSLHPEKAIEICRSYKEIRDIGYKVFVPSCFVHYDTLLQNTHGRHYSKMTLFYQKNMAKVYCKMRQIFY